jgi:Rrf2 family protein
MLRMRRITDQGFVVLAYFIASEPDKLLTARCVSEDVGLPPATAAKVLKLLQRGGFLASTRGLCGGYTLACDPAVTSVVDVIEAMEGPMSLTECAVSTAITCDSHDTCHLGHAWPSVNAAVIAALRQVTLVDLVAESPRRGVTPAAVISQAG